MELPSGATKLCRLYVPSVKHQQPVRVELNDFRDAREIAVARTVAASDALVVVISPNVSVLSFLQGAQAPAPLGVPLPPPPPGGYPGALPGLVSTGRAAQVELAHAQWGRLPASWLGWEGADAVIIADPDLGAATPPELEALTQWVRLGGTLVVAGGAQAAKLAGGPLGELLPLQVTGTATVRDLAALESWGGQGIARSSALIASGTLRPDAQVLLGTAAAPLVMARDLDAGRVLMTGFDFTAEPVKYWDGRPGSGSACWRRQHPRGPAVRYRPRPPAPVNPPTAPHPTASRRSRRRLWAGACRRSG